MLALLCFIKRFLVFSCLDSTWRRNTFDDRSQPSLFIVRSQFLCHCYCSVPILLGKAASPKINSLSSEEKVINMFNGCEPDLILFLRRCVVTVTIAAVIIRDLCGPGRIFIEKFGISWYRKGWLADLTFVFRISLSTRTRERTTTVKMKWIHRTLTAAELLVPLSLSVV